MLPRMKLVSTFLLLALMLSLMPAGIIVGHAAGGTICDSAELVADVTVPDGTNFAPGSVFKKTWRLKNNGTCAWTTAYTLVFDSGEKMGGPASVTLPSAVAPEQTIDLSVDLTAPGGTGTYIGYWKLKNATGALFGTGAAGDKAFWVNIKVSSGETAYDFVANAASAAWSSGAGALPFPGADGDARGFAIQAANLKFEDNIPSPSALLVSPQNITGGYIEGKYPSFRVQAGDKFQVRIGCESQATNCNVRFRLDYQIGATRKELKLPYPPLVEKWEGRTKPIVVSLDSLAGQDVMFILVVDANGSPTGDRALWGNPIIHRPAPPPAASCTDRATFKLDVTVPDRTTLTPSQPFTKTWRILNGGTCTWTTAYQLISYSDGVFFSNDKMGAPDTAALPITVAPGQTVDISIPFTAPAASGSYRAHFKFKNDKGVAFGLDSPNIYRLGSGNQIPLWVEIKVAGTGTVTSYDFTTNAASAVWTSGAGALTFPGTDGNASGFALKKDKPKLENGIESAQAGLLFAPNNISAGFIQGVYPVYKVKAGDRFRSIVSCEYGAASCNVTLNLDYLAGTSAEVKTLWTYVEKSDGNYYQVDIDLSPLAGQDIKFILKLRADGSLAVNRGLWVAPQIVSRQ